MVQYLHDSVCLTKNRKIYVCCDILPKPGACGNPQVFSFSNSIQAKIDDHPWMALLLYKNDSSQAHPCGGSLINERYVLTAAHCTLVQNNWQLDRVRLGEWDTSTEIDCDSSYGYGECADPHIDVDIEKVIPHENYANLGTSLKNDIALIRLARAVPYSRFIQPICLPGKKILKGEVMEIVGWGDSDVAVSTTKKLKAKVLVVPFNDCSTIYGKAGFNLEVTHLCAGGDKDIDACHGDSGGPLIGWDTSHNYRRYLFIAGIISFGPTECGKKGWPGVYTRVGRYIDWIQANIEP